MPLPMKKWFVMWTYVNNFAWPYELSAPDAVAAAKKVIDGFSEDFKVKGTVYVFDSPPVIVRGGPMSTTPDSHADDLDRLRLIAALYGLAEIDALRVYYHDPIEAPEDRASLVRWADLCAARDALSTAYAQKGGAPRDRVARLWVARGSEARAAEWTATVVRDAIARLDGDAWLASAPLPESPAPARTAAKDPAWTYETREVPGACSGCRDGGDPTGHLACSVEPVVSLVADGWRIVSEDLVVGGWTAVLERRAPASY